MNQPSSSPNRKTPPSRLRSAPLEVTPIATLGVVARAAHELRLAQHSATSPEDAGVARASEELASAVRDLALDTLDAYRRCLSDTEEIVQAHLYRWCEALTRGDVTPGREEGYIRRCAINAARSAWRKERARRKRVVPLGDRRREATTSSIEDAVIQLENDEHRARLARLALAALESAPLAYRDALERVYLRGVGHDVLVEDELRQRVDDGDLTPEQLTDPAIRRRARQTIDQRLSRGRRWLRKRLLRSL